MKIEFIVDGYVMNDDIYFAYQANVVYWGREYYLKDFSFTKGDDDERIPYVQKCELEHYYEKFGEKEFKERFKELYNKSGSFDFKFLTDAVTYPVMKKVDNLKCKTCKYQDECKYCFGFSDEKHYGYHWIDKIKVKEVTDTDDAIYPSKDIDEMMDTIEKLEGQRLFMYAIQYNIEKSIMNCTNLYELDKLIKMNPSEWAKLTLKNTSRQSLIK